MTDNNNLGSDGSKSITIDLNRITPFRAIACGDSYSDPVRVAAMLVNDKPWDEVIIVGDRHGPLYDNLRTVKMPSDLPPIDSFDCNKRTLVIFDECFTSSTAKADRMNEFFILGRRHGISTLFVEMDLLDVPKSVQRNADILYLTTDPRPHGWKEIKWRLAADAPIAECFAALSRPHHWFKIDLRNDKTEVIDASKSQIRQGGRKNDGVAWCAHADVALVPENLHRN